METVVKKNIFSFVVGAVAAVLLVGGAFLAIIAANKSNTLNPVAPTVPQSKPKAAEPEFNPSCRASFTVLAPALVCEGISLKPDSLVLTTAGGQKRELTASVSGGVAPYTFSWSLTGTGPDIGLLSASSGKTVTWTAPNNLQIDQSWTITVSATDSAGQTASGDKCKTTLTFTSTTSPSCNAFCVTSADCPGDLACVSGRCRNTACTSQTNCQCPAPLKSCNQTCTVKEECQSGMTCAGGHCRNVSCITSQSCVCQTAPPAPTPTPIPAPPLLPPAPAPVAVSTHRICRNNACVTVSGTGQDRCASDVDCKPAAAPPPIPQAGFGLPTIAILAGGIGLVVFALLAL